jgi:alpha-tubulin suppressor-like RCC1 family protein
MTLKRRESQTPHEIERGTAVITPSIALRRDVRGARRSRRHARALLPAVLAVLGMAMVLVTIVAGPGSAVTSGDWDALRMDAGSLDLGRVHGCAITASGALRCWGVNDVGQLGQGNTANIGDSAGESTVPVDLGGHDAVDVSAGEDHTCAVLDDGSVRCWGHNDHGQLGQGNTTDIGDNAGESTVQVDLGGAAARGVAAGSLHTCALMDDGSVRCWGRNNVGQLGQGNTTDIGDDSGEHPVTVPLPASVVALTTGGNFTCALLQGGELRCWGYGVEGNMAQGNQGNIGDQPGEAPVAVDFGGHAVRAVSAGVAHACAILDDGSLRCWGSSAYGMLAQGNTATIGDSAGETTVPVDLGGHGAVLIASGRLQSCAVLDDGSVRCWGFNSDGQLGLGNKNNIGDNLGEVPALVDTGGNVPIAISGGEAHTCAAWADRTVRCWGNGANGQLGIGASVYYGDGAGETPGAAPTTPLGGELFGRDADGDGVRDALDACASVPAPGTTNGCPPATPSPTASPTPTPTAPPTVAPEVTLHGKTVRVKAFVKDMKPRGGCPAKASTSVRRGTHVLASKPLHTTKLTRRGVNGCLVKGRIKLAKQPAASAKVKAVISGKNLKTRRIPAIRV